MTTTSPLPIDVISDVVCPWCYIGKRRLEQEIALKPEIPVEVHFRPYFLNPWVPREGISRNEYLATKFGSPAPGPWLVARVAEEVAKIKRLPVDEAMFQISANTCQLFDLAWA